VIRSILIGLVAGMRSMAPLAVASTAVARGELEETGPMALLGHPAVSTGLSALAVAEAMGDKLPFAPDRIVIPGIAARIVTGALAGAALAPREQRNVAAVLAAGAAVAASYWTFRLRVRAMRRYGQARTGVVEDALVLAASQYLVSGAKGGGR